MYITWIRFVSLTRTSWSKVTLGVHWDIKGIIVGPEWPPITGTLTSEAQRPLKMNKD